MPATDRLMPMLRERLRVDPSPSSIGGSLPVLFFGDALRASIATIGLNPSKFEYVARNDKLLAGSEQRFATLASLGAPSRAELSVAKADTAIAIMRAYYDVGKPVYGSYFRHLTNFLRGMGASYGGRTATHLDVVQESTDPVWRNLGADERARLLDRDLPFLAWELEHLPHLQVVVCAGATVSQQLRNHVSIEEREAGNLKRIRWWLGRARVGQRELLLAGWNYPLDRATGLGTAGEVELGEMLARKLLG